jgi:LytS/YehU family sensor histidine kinase
MQPKIRILLLVIITIAVTFLMSYLFSNVQLHFRDFGPYYKPFIRGNIVRDLIIAFFILLTSQLMYLSQKQQQTALENKTLMAENMRTRYEALKNQVDPHFLFNSLNTLNALIKIDADKAQQYVQQLSYVFRYTLQNKEIISLEEELKFTQAYCHLMQIRYGDCLRFEYQIDSRFNNYTIIPLSLQTLVENAIKHNVVSAKQPLTISFVTTGKGTVSVSNPIQLKKESESGEGIGLANLSERYRLMWQQEVIVTQNDGIFRVEVTLNE